MPIEWEEYKGEDWKGKKRENEGGTHRNSPNPDIIIAIPPAMPLDITDKGLLLESSHKSMAGLPMQAFAISLSDHDIEDMIASVQNGNRLELSLGSSPVSSARALSLDPTVNIASLSPAMPCYFPSCSLAS